MRDGMDVCFVSFFLAKIRQGLFFFIGLWWQYSLWGEEYSARTSGVAK